MMNIPKGLTITMIIEAESANYGESVGNVASLKKMTRGQGEQYTYAKVGRGVVLAVEKGLPLAHHA